MWLGKKHRYLYLNACDSPTKSGPLQAIWKLDKKSAEQQFWSPAPRGFSGEPIFVPRTSGTQEDDGWVLSVVYDAAMHRSYLVILDAQNIKQVIAKLHLKHHIPHGFHGNWTPKVFL